MRERESIKNFWLVSRMVFLVVAVAVASPAAAGAAGKQGDRHEAARYPISEIMDSVLHRGEFQFPFMTNPSFSPDGGKVLSSTNASGIYNAHAMPVGGGEAVALTASVAEAVLAVGYFPDDERFLYASDQGGNELVHLYVREQDGRVVDLTPGERLRAQFVQWAGDGKSFFVSTNERDPRFFDLYEIATDGYARTMIFQNDKAYDIAAVSPDRQTVALSVATDNANRDIFFFDRSSGEISPATPAEDNVVSNPQTFSRDGTAFYYTTDQDHEFQYLVKLDVETGKRRVIKKIDWDILRVRLSRGGKYLILGVMQDARVTLYGLDAVTHEDVKLPDFSKGSVTGYGFSADDKSLAVIVSNGRIPSDLYVADMSGGVPRQLNRSLSPTIKEDDLVEGRVVWFTSFDGLEIPGLLYKPHQAAPNHMAPALVWIHGGPGGITMTGHNALIQYLVNHGYVVYAINNRGSTGYGKTFFHLDDRDHGAGDLRDVVWSKKMLTATGYVDSGRIGVIGGSYGGYMVLAALAFAPKEFTVGVDMFGVANWLRTLNSIPPWWASARAYLESEIGDFDDEKYLRAISPLFHASNIIRPLIVLQGANDPRVLKVESDEIVEAVRNNGVPVEYVLFADEGHGLRKRVNQIEAYEKILKFLDQYLAE